MIELNKVRIGVTGGGGFLGKAVIKKLLETGVNKDQILAPRSSEVNLLDYEKTLSFVKKIDLLIHLAADVGGILYNKNYPGDLITNNLQMGINVMNASKEFGIEKVVNIGTTCMFPANAELPFKEEDIFSGYPAEVTAPYGISKIALFEISKAYKKQFGLNSINVIPVNLYGPGDHFEGENTHVVPALINRFFEAKKENNEFIEIWGTGVATREFLYVEDAAAGIIKALIHYNETDPVNLGTGVETSIKFLAEAIKEVVGYKGEIIWDSTKPDGTLRRCVDVNKAKERFGFEATTSLLDGLNRTINWYRASIR